MAASARRASPGKTCSGSLNERARSLKERVEQREGDGLKTLLRWVGRIFLALAVSFLVGIVIGTLLRAKIEQQVYYIGYVRAEGCVLQGDFTGASELWPVMVGVG